ncbi:MAG: hypothetical protein HGB37_02610 [Candidatus Moranbacteria bacterium]|jgi:glucose uptake protein GlcU|nr:hypothetical protein [Candidatus Moranbacteria bacterium]
MIGYVFAVLSSIFLSLYVVPRKLSTQPPAYFSLFMSVGFFLGSLAMYLAQYLLGFHEVWSFALLWAALAGVIWAAGFVTFIRSIDAVGLARSNQWKNLQGPVGVILSLVMLGEYAKADPFFAVLAGLAVFVSAAFFSVSDSKEEARRNVRGICMAAASGVAFGSVAVINKYVTTNVGVYSQQVVWSFAMLSSLSAYVFFHKSLSKGIKEVDRRNVSLGLVAGLLYLGASYFMLESYKYIPASIGFTIIQLNAIWTISIGLFVFKEIDIRKHYVKISLGFLFSLVGIALLVFARK